MSKTRNQLVHRAIKELGMLPVDTSYASVDELVDGLVISLRERQICDIMDVENLEEELFQPVARCLAYAAFPEMGVTDQALIQRLMAQRVEAEMEIQAIVAAEYTGNVAEGTYY